MEVIRTAFKCSCDIKELSYQKSATPSMIGVEGSSRVSLGLLHIDG